MNRLYAIADADAFGAEALPGLVAAWAAAGVGSIQLRMKGASDGELLDVGRRCQEALTGAPTWFWVNDSVPVALELNAKGVHLGQEDETPAEARTRLAEDQLIGRSTHNLAQAKEAAADPFVDLVAVGPIFPTGSKANPEPVVGLSELARIRAAIQGLLVAIGGINLNNCRAVVEAGADCVAMIGALRADGDDLDMARERAAGLLRRLGD